MGYLEAHVPCEPSVWSEITTNCNETPGTSKDARIEFTVDNVRRIEFATDWVVCRARDEQGVSLDVWQGNQAGKEY